MCLAHCELILETVSKLKEPSFYERYESTNGIINAKTKGSDVNHLKRLKSYHCTNC